MRFYNLSIKQRLYGTAIVITVLLLFIGIFTKLSLETTFSNHNLLNETKNLLISELSMRKAEKDFLALETINDRFYSMGESKHVQNYKQEYLNAISILRKLKKDESIKELDLTDNVKQLEFHFKNYYQAFNDLVYKVKIKGFKDYGTIGKMRDEIHKLETAVEKEHDLQASYFMLMLRRHEKDYLIRKDLKYSEKFKQTFQNFVNYIPKTKHNNLYKEELSEHLKSYKKHFFTVVENDKSIGFTNQGGILKNMNENVSAIENTLAGLQENIQKSSRAGVEEAVVWLFAILVFVSFAIMVLIFNTAQNFIRPVKKLKNHIRKLGKGELPENIKFIGENEISEMGEYLNFLTQNLKNTRDFAIEVGNGNLQTKVNVFNNQGDLGGSLVEMRKRLLKVSKERDAAHKRSEIRLWMNSGMNEITELLRSDFDSLTDLSRTLISKIVKTLDVNQGAIFLQKADDEKVFELFAARAYGRDKFLKKEIKLGHDLVGTCAIEKETIFMTDIPEDYISITSGLGTSNPKCLVIVPMKHNNEVTGIIEIAAFQILEKHHIEFLEKAASYFAAVLVSLKQEEKTRKLLEQSEFQANELLAQEEELRQNLEELSATQEAMTKNEESLKERIEELEKEHQLKLEKIEKQQELEKQTNRMTNEFYKLFDSTQLLGSLNVNAEFVSMNKKVSDVFELPPIKMRKKSIKKFLFDSEIVNFDINWMNIINGETRQAVYEFVTAEEKRIHLKINFSPVFSEKRKVQRVLFVATPLENYDKRKHFKEFDEFFN